MYSDHNVVGRRDHGVHKKVHLVRTNMGNAQDGPAAALPAVETRDYFAGGRCLHRAGLLHTLMHFEERAQAREW